MMAVATLFCFVFSVLLHASVSDDVHAVVNGSVQLNTQTPEPEYTDFAWKFNQTKFVVKYKNTDRIISPSKLYKDRVEFNTNTLSLTLKNLQKTDSGLYELKASDDDNEHIITEYRLSVLDPVETPELTHQQYNSTCNFTLTCNGSALSISSSFYDETCEEKTHTSPGGVTLSLFVNASSIICNHSNPVSWKENSLKMEKLKQCLEWSREPFLLQQSPGFLWTAVLCAVLGVIIITAIVYRKRSRGRQQTVNTLYAEVEGTRPALTLETPTTVYHTVGESVSNRESIPATENQNNIHGNNQQSAAPLNTYDSVPDMKQLPLPETIYATVSKPSKAVNEPHIDKTTLN